MKGFKNVILVLAIIVGGSQIANAAGSNQSAGFYFSIAFGSVSSPAYLGADTQQLIAVPSFNVSYSDRFFASLGEAGFNFVNANGWRAGPIVKYDVGRLENGDNPLLIGGDETTDLKGLGDIEGSIKFGGF